MKKQVTIRQALQNVADNPVIQTDDIIALPVHELVCRTLFEIANGVKTTEPRSLTRANAARTMIFERMVGRRRAGSHPATKKQTSLQFRNLTGEVEA
jgi:hypothetical protein